MNTHLYLSSEELEALAGLPHFVFRLYIALKMHADFASGIVGQKRRISWSLLCQELYVEQHQGFDDVGSPTRQRVARAMEWLKKQELVQDLGSKKRGEAIVFKLLLARTASSVQNKPVQNPCRTRAAYPEQEEMPEYAKESRTNAQEKEKPVQNPCSSKSKNPSDINNQISKIPTDTNVIPNIPPVVNIHTSSSASPSARQPSLSEQVSEVFEYWQHLMQSPRAVLDAKRKARIEWAIKTYGKESCILAVDGCARSDWHMGKNDRGQRYNDLTLIFRDAEKFERFLAEPPTSSTKRSGISDWLSQTQAIEAEVVYQQPKIAKGGLS